jgi:phosphate:Na+ symporter
MSVGTMVMAELLGGITLLLWGVRMVRTGVIRGWGEQLKLFLERQLHTRLRAFGSGLLLTTILGSSTAMVLIVTGLVAGGTMTPVTGLVIVLGADVGSALIAAVLSSGASHTALLAPVALCAGYAIFSGASGFRGRALGRVLMGLGMMLLALRLIVAASDPLRDAPMFHAMIEALVSEPVVAFVIAAVLTWLVHSSLAILLVLSSFVLTGGLDAVGAIPLILGLNLGAGLPAVTATLDQPPAARRVPLANLTCRAFVAVVGLIFVDATQAMASSSGLSPLALVATLHLGFNLVAAIAFVPVAAFLLRMAERIIPDPDATGDGLSLPRYLNMDVAISPRQALSNAAVETLRMAEILDRMLQLSLSILRTGRLERTAEISETNALLTQYMTLVTGYLGALPAEETSAADAQQAFVVMNCAINLSNAGDAIKLNLSRRITAKVKSGLSFDATQESEIARLSQIIAESLRLLAPALTSADIQTSAALARQKDRFRQAEDRIILESLTIARTGQAAVAGATTAFIEIIHDLHRINSLVASSGYPVVSAAGLLRSSRIDGEMQI